MGKIIKINKKKDNIEKQYAASNNRYKHSNLTLYRYNNEYNTCLKLFIIKYGEFPIPEEFIKIPVYEGRKYVKKLHQLYEEKADQRNKSLTGQTLFDEVMEKHLQWYCDLTGDTFDKDKKD
jgi:hypothetical protein